MRDTIRDAVARTAFVTSYADAIDSGECLACDAVQESADVDKEDRTVLLELWDGDTCRNCGRSFPRAGSGEEWFNVVSELPTPPEATAWADEVLRDFETLNRRGAEGMAEDWEALTGHDTDRFGHCVAMQYLGHGVGLSDDMPTGADWDEPKTGDREFYVWDYDSASLATD